jgi:hypothetical protein
MMSIYRSAEALRQQPELLAGSGLHLLSMRLRSADRGMRRGAAELQTEDASVEKNWISRVQAIGDAVDVESSDPALRMSPPDLSYSAAAVMVTAIATAQRQLFAGCNLRFVAVAN